MTTPRRNAGSVQPGADAAVGDFGPERIRGSIRLYPVEGVSAYPFPAVEFFATPEQWAELQAFQPPPFTDKPPPGEKPGAQPEGPSEQDGSSDTPEV